VARNARDAPSQAMEKSPPKQLKSLATRTAGRDQTILGDLRLSWRSSLSTHHHSRASGQKSLLLACHGRAPSPSTPLLQIKVTGSRKPLTRGKRSGDFLFRMQELLTLRHSITPAVEDEDSLPAIALREGGTTSSRTIGKFISGASKPELVTDS